MLIDICILVLVLVAFYLGYKRGLVASLFFFLAMIISVIAALKLGHVCAVQLQEWFNTSSKYLPLIAFAVVFVAVFILIKLLSRMIEGFFKALQLSLLNRLAGAVFWCVAWVLFASTIIWYADQMELFTTALKQESITFEYIENFTPKVVEGIGTALPFVKSAFTQIAEFFDTISGNAAAD